MRYIKFRAWHKDIEIISYYKEDDTGFNCFQFLDEYDDRHSSDYTLDSALDSDCIELMQYTGLKDKNGKEIYEGDIVKETFRGGHRLHEICIGEYDNEEDYEDRDCGYGVYAKTHCWRPDYGFSINGSPFIIGEIIGNIYENPDLLKGMDGN